MTLRLPGSANLPPTKKYPDFATGGACWAWVPPAAASTSAATQAYKSFRCMIDLPGRPRVCRVFAMPAATVIIAQNAVRRQPGGNEMGRARSFVVGGLDRRARCGFARRAEGSRPELP